LTALETNQSTTNIQLICSTLEQAAMAISTQQYKSTW